MVLREFPRLVSRCLRISLPVLLISCVPGETWKNTVEPEPYMPPPPSHLLRKPADFRITDPHLQKEFFLYMYEDESIREEVIMVINYALPEGARRPRFATRDEADYAMGLFIADWASRGEHDRIRYFNRRHDEELYRKSTQLDDQIEHKKDEKRWWETQVLNLESDLTSRKNTSTFAGGNEKFNLAPTAETERQLAHARRRQVVSEAQLAILEYKRAIRDSQYARAGAIFVDSTIGVTDLLPNYSQPERLIDDIRQHVQPFAWGYPETRMTIVEGQLVVRHTRDVVVLVRDYVDQLRAEFIMRAKAKEVVPPKQ